MVETEGHVADPKKPEPAREQENANSEPAEGQVVIELKRRVVPEPHASLTRNLLESFLHGDGDFCQVPTRKQKGQGVAMAAARTSCQGLFGSCRGRPS